MPQNCLCRIRCLEIPGGLPAKERTPKQAGFILADAITIRKMEDGPTPNPLGFDDGANLYAYLHHNPLNDYGAYGLQYEAYTDSTKAALSAVNYAGPSAFAGIDRRPVPTSSQDRASYINGSNAHACAAGIAHGGVVLFPDNAVLSPWAVTALAE